MSSGNSIPPSEHSTFVEEANCVSNGDATSEGTLSFVFFTTESCLETVSAEFSVGFCIDSAGLADISCVTEESSSETDDFGCSD